MRNVAACESQYKMSFKAFKMPYDPEYFKLILSSAMKKVSWAMYKDLHIHVVSWTV